MSLSSIYEIGKEVRFNDNDFSFVKTMGDIAQNSDFTKGFLRFINDRKESGDNSTHIWECLSAIGDDIGDTLYQNVEKYVDFVSNVETCKVTALRSMMKMYGFDYTVLDNIELIPVEILNLMDILSINRKYLVKSDSMGKVFQKDLMDNGVITEKANQISDYIYDGLSDELSSYDSKIRTFDENKYTDYINSLYGYVLSGFITLPYNLSSEGKDFAIYKTLSLSDFQDTDTQKQRGGQIIDFIRIHNIEKSFDYIGIVDDIDNGKDSLDNYSYPKRELLELEIQNRQSKLDAVIIKDIVGDSADYGRLTKDNSSRYSYYRKQKMLEYVKFINNKYFIDNLQGLDVKIYDVDSNYFEMKDGTLSTVVVLDPGNGNTVNGQMIESVARSLTVATEYITRLREKIKLQSRKYYMKGTQNLLLYVINEYLIDYARHQSKILGKEECSKLSAQLTTMLSHDINQMSITEYYDETEYFNQRTSTTDNALNSKEANEDFWTFNDMNSDDGISYKLAQIRKFYLDAMSVRDHFINEEDLGDFLQTVFEAGADKSYVSRNDGRFTTRLSTYDMDSDEVYSKWVEMTANYQILKSYIPNGFQFDSSKTVDDQISDMLTAISDDMISKYVVDEHHMSSTYSSETDRIDDDVKKLNDEYGQLLSGDMIFYFRKSDNSNCYDDDGRYLHDYFIGNGDYGDG